MEIKHLTAAAQLTLYRVDDDYIVVLEHVCLDRQTVSGRLVKVMSWYDNEWGFSNRMLDTACAMMAAK